MDIAEYNAELSATLSRACASITRTAKGAFVTEGQTWSIAVDANNVYCATRLRTLTLTTHYSVINGELTPTFGHRRDSLPYTLTWTAPEDCRLWFALAVSGEPWTIGNAYLIATGDSPGYWILPTGNQMVDGSLCTGERMNALAAPTLLDLCAAAHNDLSATAWNADLAPNLGHTAAVFRWTIQGEQLPPRQPWTNYCTRRNNLTYDLLPIERTAQWLATLSALEE